MPNWNEVPQDLKCVSAGPSPLQCYFIVIPEVTASILFCTGSVMAEVLCQLTG